MAKWLSIRQAARKMGLAPNQLQWLCETKKIRPIDCVKQSKDGQFRVSVRYVRDWKAGGWYGIDDYAKETMTKNMPPPQDDPPTPGLFVRIAGVLRNR